MDKDSAYPYRWEDTTEEDTQELWDRGTTVIGLLEVRDPQHQRLVDKGFAEMRAGKCGNCNRQTAEMDMTGHG